MENGSFHTSPPSILEADDIVKKVPLPFEMPKGMDFSRAPAERPGASTIETLIGQNEDLMARLGVSLRRTTQLEEKLEHLERENSLLRHRFETIKESMMVLQQKDQLSSQRNQSLTEEGTELKIQLKKLEQRYTDLYLQAQTMQESVVRLERYRARIKKVSKNIQARAKQAGKLSAMNLELATQQASQVQAFEAKLHECKVAMDAMTERLLDRDQLYDSKIQLENKLIFIERQHENYRQDVEGRIARQEATLREKINSELLETHAELHALQARTQIELQAQKEQVTEELTALQTRTHNEIKAQKEQVAAEVEQKLKSAKTAIETERRLVMSQLFEEKKELDLKIARIDEDLEVERRLVMSQLDEEREQMQTALRIEKEVFLLEQETIRGQVDVVNVQLGAERQKNEELTKKAAHIAEELEALKNQTRIHIAEFNNLSEAESKARQQIELIQINERNLKEQVDALQVLWQDKQRTMDKLEDKNNSLQKLNQQLSLNLNQARKELSLAKNDAEFERQQHQEQMQALREEIRMLKLQIK